MAISSTNKNHWYLFLLFPFFAAVFAMKNYKIYWAKNIIWAFVVFFGFSFGLAKETSSGEETADVFRSFSQLEELHKMDVGFIQIVKLYTTNEDIDILKLTISIVISRFTDSQQVLLAVYGLIFGFFFSRNMWFVLDRLKGRLKRVTLLLFVAYFLVDPIWNINGFRFHTATHMFIYGLLPFLYGGKKKSLWMCLLSVLVHFSFILPVLVLGAYLIIGNRTVAYFVFFLVSIAASEINVAGFNSIVEANAPAYLIERTSTYRDEGKVEEYREGTKGGELIQSVWYAKIYLKTLYWPLMVFLIFLFFKRKKIERISSSFLSSLCFTLFYWGVANFMSSLPSGVRYVAIAALAALPLIIFYIQNQAKEEYLSKKVLMASPAILLFIIVSIRVGFYSLSVNTILGNPLVALFTNNIALNDLIK